jgi:predicted Zn-dependent protease with MMP-like domain
MLEITDSQFETAVAEAMDSLSKQMSEVKNVGIVMADEPTPDQRTKLLLRNDQSLFGLYEGIPLTKRNNNYSGVLPDKITLFKLPLSAYANSYEEFKEQVRHTLWHELAHHFGLDHDGIHARE